ncbi:MAG: hypothetical protein AAGG53_12320 [Cyanobacteria bacterium P01_H01_bin.152]
MIATLAKQQNRAQLELRESINDVVSMISELAQQHEQRQEESRQRQEEFESQQAEFRQQQAEFKQRHEEYKREQQEFSVRFENLLNDARADWQLNEQEHRAFRETVQTLLAEISHWRRLAG